MGEIQGQVLAADVNDDGKIELVTTDTRGNVAAWTSQGKEIWEVHLKSLIAQVYKSSFLPVYAFEFQMEVLCRGKDENNTYICQLIFLFSYAFFVQLLFFFLLLHIGCSVQFIHCGL